MKDNTVPVLLSIGLFLILLGFVVNLKIEADCISQGGQVLSTPGQISSCLK